MNSNAAIDSLPYERAGCRDAEGFGGRAALAFDNPSGAPARDFVRLPGCVPGKDDFTLRLWLKTELGGCHGWCCGEDFLPQDAPFDPSAQSPAQRAHGSVLAANGVFDALTSAGLLLAHPQPRAYLTVHFRPQGAPEAVQFSGLRDTYDGRWHMLTLSCDRRGTLALYIDRTLRAQADIRAYAGLSLGDAPLTLGADARGENGFGPGWISRFSFEKRALPAGEIETLYDEDALSLLMSEIAARNLPGCGLYDAAAARAFLQDAETLCSTSALPAAARLRALRARYEDFLLQTRAPDLKFVLFSDAHCDGDEGGRTQALRRGLAWANALGMQAIVDGGDYSNFGKDFELDSYWHAIDDLWKDKPLFVTVGNHETLHSTCDELVRYHCGHLARQGMTPAGYDKFFYAGECAGYHFIVLAQYSDTYTVTGYKRMWRYAAEIKPEQIDFLKRQLDACCGQGKPVFVIIHNSVGSLLDRQTGGKFLDDSAILDGDALYETLRRYPDVVVCTGHVHHGPGAGAGFHRADEGYGVIDIPGFRGGVLGYGIDAAAPAGTRHPAFFASLFGTRLLLRAVDFATGEWLTAYDQLLDTAP